MGFHVYCIVPTEQPIPDGCTGLGGVRPVALEHCGLALWATAHEDPVPASIAAARVHNRVVNAAMTPLLTPVPVRFGQWFASPDEAVQRLADEAAKWKALLERFAGRAEYGVRVQRHGPDAERDVQSAAAESGREYMAALARKQAQVSSWRREAERIAAIVEERVGHFAVDRRIEHMASGELVLAIAHLVAWHDAAGYDKGIRAVSEGVAEARIVLTGPWPPWSFVE